MIANFRKKQKFHGNPYSFFPLSLIKFFFLLIIIFLVFMNVRVYKEKRKFDLQVVSLEKKIEGLRQKNSQLEQKIARSDDKDYIEKIAREELNLQMPSEKVITFLLPELQQGEINSSGSFLNIKNWLGWISNSWQWVINFSK